MKPDFERCTNLATMLLYQQKIEDRILDIRSLTYDKKIYFDTIQGYAFYTRTPISAFPVSDDGLLKDGCTLVLGNDEYLILYNNQVNNYEHLNWTLAHEIGHIYLGHTQDGPIEEIEAHFFAAQLFMPEYSLYMMHRNYGPVYAKDLVEIFGVSPEAARNRIKTMNKKSMFSASQKDKEIWEQQEKRVKLYHEVSKDRDAFRCCLAYDLYFKDMMESELRSSYAYI